MSRTTLDIDDAILRDLKRLQKAEQKSLGQLVSELLAGPLAQRRQGPRAPPTLNWESRPMGARVNLTDKDALWALLDAPPGKAP